MVKAELGTKRTCPSCGTKFYDLLKSPIICPKCGVSFIASVVGPDRIRPLIMRVGGRAARAGLALMLGTAVYMLYYFLTL